MSDKSQRADAPEASRESVGEILRTIAYALAIALVFRTVLFQPFSIPSGSMKSTLLVGDYLFVSKYSYGYSRYSLPFGSLFPTWLDGRLFAGEPERGDVIVFRNPNQPRVDLIKRVVGLPGDIVEMRRGVLYVNGVEVEQTSIGDFVEPFSPQGTDPRAAANCDRQRSVRPDQCLKAAFVVELRTDPGAYDPTAPDAYEGETITHVVLHSNGASSSLADNFGPIVVPEGELFFMGDNRDHSDDSRGSVGTVPMEYLVGRAEFILLSSGAPEGQIWQFWNWRSDRFFQAIE